MADIFVPAYAQKVTVGSGNLFAVAALYLGDATKWNQISDLNAALDGDPFFNGITTLILPASTILTNGGLIGR